MKNLTLFFAGCMALCIPELVSGSDGIRRMIDFSGAIITSSHADIGTVQNCFDGDSTTLMRSDVNPAWIQVEFPSIIAITGIRVLLGQVGYTVIDEDDFWVEAANSIPDMNNKTGSYVMVIPRQMNVAGYWYYRDIPDTVAKRIWKIWVNRTLGDDYVPSTEGEISRKGAKIAELTNGG